MVEEVVDFRSGRWFNCLKRGGVVEFQRQEFSIACDRYHNLPYFLEPPVCPNQACKLEAGHPKVLKPSERAHRPSAFLVDFDFNDQNYLNRLRLPPSPPLTTSVSQPFFLKHHSTSIILSNDGCGNQAMSLMILRSGRWFQTTGVLNRLRKAARWFSKSRGLL